MNLQYLDITFKVSNNNNDKFWNDVGDSLAEGVPVLLIVIGVIFAICALFIISGIIVGMQGNTSMSNGTVIEKIPGVKKHEPNSIMFEIEGKRICLKVFNDNIYNTTVVGDNGVITYKGEYLTNFQIKN